MLQALSGSAEQPTTAIYAPVYLADSPHILESLMVVYTRSYGYILVASMAQGPLHYFFISNSDSIRSWIQVTIWSQKDEDLNHLLHYNIRHVWKTTTRDRSCRLGLSTSRIVFYDGYIDVITQHLS